MTETAPTNTWKEINLAWEGDGTYLASNKDGGVVRTGRSSEGDQVIGPMEMLLVGLGGCTALDVIDILTKMRQHPVSFQINVRGNQRTDVYPKVYTAFEIEYLLWGDDLVEKDVAHAIELSTQRYCSVGGTLVKAGPITHSFRILPVSEKNEQND